ncbi:MAG TPA: diguanylate cyclase [Acidobacteriota bacterium]
MEKGLNVLLLSGDAHRAKSVQKTLAASKDPLLQPRWEEYLAKGLARLDVDPIDALLVDLHLEDSRGLATFFKVREKAPQLPIIILVDLEDSSLGLEAVKRGAQDSLLYSQITPKILAQAITAGIQYKKNEEHIREIAFQDPLTRLFNRRGFAIVAGHQLMLAQRTKNPMVLVFADILHLENINQGYGYEEGDVALMGIAAIMKTAYRRSDVMARLDADEFLLLAINCGAENAQKLVDRWKAKLDDLRARKNMAYDLSLALGTAAFDPEAPCTLETFICRAQLQMEESKRKNKPSD